MKTADKFIHREVESSNIAAVSFCIETGLMMVKFKSGAVYGYTGLVWKDFDDLINAESVGKHFNSVIKGKFSYFNLDDAVPFGVKS